MVVDREILFNIIFSYIFIFFTLCIKCPCNISNITMLLQTKAYAVALYGVSLKHKQLLKGVVGGTHRDKNVINIKPFITK